MSFLLECKKVRRTGLIPGFFFGGILAAAFPVVNIALRTETFVSKPGTPLEILLGENWQMMAMLNVLFMVSGSCLMYHEEFADNAMQKMNALPTRGNSLFRGKSILLCLLSVVMLVMEGSAVVFCAARWFSLGDGFWLTLGKALGYSVLLSLPCILLSLLISSVCKNMWVSLGIGVICIFTATILPSDNFLLSLFPYSLPFRLIFQTAQPERYLWAVLWELVGILLAELLIVRIRRAVE